MLLQELENDETLLVQSGKPVGIFRTHPDAPRVLIANANLEVAKAGKAVRESSSRHRSTSLAYEVVGDCALPPTPHPP